jgi:hypothetical protein
VFFGATVRLRDAAGAARTISIVGVDEIDTGRGYISWVSPMARALIKAREGDTARQHAGGAEDLEIVEVRLRRACDRRRGRATMTSTRVSADRAARAAPIVGAIDRAPWTTNSPRSNTGSPRCSRSAGVAGGQRGAAQRARTGAPAQPRSRASRAAGHRAPDALLARIPAE